MRKTLAFLLVVVAMLSLSACITVDFGSALDPALTEITVGDDGRKADGKILIVDISGMVKNGADRDFFNTYATPGGIKKVLNRAETDPSIRALILRINSPGGGVTASDLIYHEIAAYKQRTGIPVYATTLSVAASGGYYIAMAADEVYAAPTSIIGSIGVIARFPNLSGLASKVGYSELVVKSAENKDIGHPLRDVSPEQQAIFQAMVDDMYRRFLDVVVAARPAIASAEQLKPIADGRVYTPTQAQANGLIDGVLYLDQLVEKIKRDRQLTAADLIMYRYGRSPDSNIYSRLSPEINVLNLDVKALLGPVEPGLHYLWMPVEGDDG